MYESESNFKQITIDNLPPNILQHFKDTNDYIQSCTVMSWSEHCVECVWPTCYQTCSLYSPRENGSCRLFVDGMVRIEMPEALNGYILKIAFKLWGKLWSPGNTRLHRKKVTQKIEYIDYIFSKMIRLLIIPKSFRILVSKKYYSLKKRYSRQRKNLSSTPDCFIMECYNPYSENVGLTVTFRSDNTKNSRLIFQRGIKLAAGYTRVEIPIEEIVSYIDMGNSFIAEITHDQQRELTEIFFGFIGFAKKTINDSKTQSKKIKCVIWDLDNTLWNGVLVEDGPEKIKLRDGIREIISELDQRGILQSIASKNSHDDAITCLKRFGIDEYFLHPQISWGPKSESIKQIAKKLNIGLDTFLFVDDQIFEREEVKTGCIDVRTIDAADFNKIIIMPECMHPKTIESSKRRLLYKQEEQRDHAKEMFDGKYMDFLKSCHLTLKISSLVSGNLNRVYELAQRTNQMNFSGNRYSLEELNTLSQDQSISTYVLECEDRYGKYGIVGFCAIEKDKPILVDLMFSCRVQSKRIEHAFLAYILQKYLPESNEGFWVNYKKTEKNKNSAKVFGEMQFDVVSESDNIVLLKFPKNRHIPSDQIITIFEAPNEEVIESSQA